MQLTHLLYVIVSSSAPAGAWRGSKHDGEVAVERLVAQLCRKTGRARPGITKAFRCPPNSTEPWSAKDEQWGRIITHICAHSSGQTSRTSGQIGGVLTR